LSPHLRASNTCGPPLRTERAQFLKRVSKRQRAWIRRASVHPFNDRVTLEAGQQQIAIKALAGGWNLRSVMITKS
jgi:hypothetical protein